MADNNLNFDLDAPDIKALVAELKHRYEAPLLEIFECSPT